MTIPKVKLSHLDNLWFQISGTFCDIFCLHCFNDNGPNVRTFGFLRLARVCRETEAATELGVKGIFFTDGGPFLHLQLFGMPKLSLDCEPKTVLGNGMLINDRIAAG